MAKLNHPHIVRILGATRQGCHFNMFVEWMPGKEEQNSMCFRKLNLVKTGVFSWFVVQRKQVFKVTLLSYISLLFAHVMATDDDVFYRRVGGVPAGCLRKVLGGCHDQLHAAGAPWHRVSPWQPRAAQGPERLVHRTQALELWSWILSCSLNASQLTLDHLLIVKCTLNAQNLTFRLLFAIFIYIGL